jgi:hypothetical protein
MTAIVATEITLVRTGNLVVRLAAPMQNAAHFDIVIFYSGRMAENV